MNALYLTVFVSSMLAVGAVVLFVWGWSKGEHDHLDRVSLLPLDDDAGRGVRPSLMTSGLAPTRERESNR